MLTTSEASGDVAGVGAILPALVSVGREGLSAACAGKGVHGFPVDGLWMSVPPALAALVRTELDLLPAGHLHDGFSAVLAAADIRLIYVCLRGLLAGETIPVAVGHHLIFRKTEGVCYIGITESGSAEIGYSFLLVTGHDAFTSSFHWRLGAVLSGGFFTDTKKSLRAFRRTLAGYDGNIGIRTSSSLAGLSDFSGETPPAPFCIRREPILW